MAVGTRTTYTDPNVKPESLNPLISMIDWTEAGLLRLLGIDNQSRFKFTMWPRTVYEWLEDSMSSREDTLSANINASTTTVPVADGSKFKEGDVIEIGDEQMYVEVRAGNTLTVIRGDADTTAASHSSGAAVHRITIARPEGSDYDTGHTTEVNRFWNTTQIFAEAVSVTGSQKVDKNYGVADDMARQIAKLIGGGEGIGDKGKAGTLALMLQNTFYKGRRLNDTNDRRRRMGGFEYYVTTNVTDKQGDTLELKDIHDLMETCFLAGGAPNMLITNTHGQRKIASWFEGSIRTERTEEQGGSVINSIRTPFGDIEVMFDRWCPASRLYLIEKEKMGWVSYRPWNVYDRDNRGDYEVKEVLGEFGFVLQNEEAHGIIKNFNASN